MQHPVPALLPALALLGLLAWPVLGIQLGSGGIKELPPRAESRSAYNQIAANFPQQDQETIPVVLDYRSGGPLSADRGGYARRLAATLAGLPGVLSIDDPAASPGSPSKQADVGPHILVLQVHSSYQPNSPQARSLLTEVRSAPQPTGGRKLATGTTASV